MKSRKYLTGLTLLAVSALSAAPEHQYRVVVSDDLNQLNVEAKIGANTTRLRIGSRAAVELLRGAQTCAGRKLNSSGRTLRLPPGTDCVMYQFDLAEANQRQRRPLPGTAKMAAPGDWLWRPDLGETDTLAIRFAGPEGMQVSVPWPGDGAGTYIVGKSLTSSSAMTLFGDFDYQELPVPGAVLRVALLKDSAGEMDAGHVVTWLKEAARGVSLVYGRFPNAQPQVIVVPSGPSPWGTGSAVPFGRVVRGGGEAVHFFLQPGRPLEDYLGDWTATHEFSHLLAPFVRDRWVSEGLASYYQNILMARAGHYTPTHAWSRLHAGIERARATTPAISAAATSNAGGTRNQRMMTYWSGAALLLLADVTLRETTNGAESLDVLLGRLQQCCLPSNRSWSAAEFFAQLDRLSTQSVMTTLYRRHANQPGVVNLDKLYGRLGLRVVSADELELAELAPALSVRAAIMAAPTAPLVPTPALTHTQSTNP